MGAPVGSSSSARPKPIHLCEVVLQQRMFPGCDPFRTEEERPTMFFIQVPFPSRRHWVSECLPRNVNQPRFGLRVDAEIACVAKDHAPRQHRIVDAEGGWDGGVSRFAQEASMCDASETSSSSSSSSSMNTHNSYCLSTHAPVGFSRQPTATPPHFTTPFRHTDPVYTQGFHRGTHTEYPPTSATGVTRGSGARRRSAVPLILTNRDTRADRLSPAGEPRV